MDYRRNLYPLNDNTIKCYDTTTFTSSYSSNWDCNIYRTEYFKNYRINHKEDTAIYNKNYRMRHQDKIKYLNQKHNNEKMICSCGCYVGKVNLLRHLQTEKHYKKNCVNIFEKIKKMT